MLMMPLTQALLGAAALGATAIAAVLVVKRHEHAHLWMIIAGAIGFVFFLTFDPIPFEIVAPVLLIATGVVLMTPQIDVSDVLDDIDVGESTATRRRR
jgi:hypothetical protein